MLREICSKHMQCKDMPDSDPLSLLHMHVHTCTCVLTLAKLLLDRCFARCPPVSTVQHESATSAASSSGGVIS